MNSSELNLSIGGGAKKAVLSVLWVNGPSNRAYSLDASWFDESGKCEAKDVRVVPRFEQDQTIASWRPGSHQVHIFLRCKEPRLPHGWRSAMAATSSVVSPIQQIGESGFQQEAAFRDADLGTHIVVRLSWSTIDDDEQ